MTAAGDMPLLRPDLLDRPLLWHGGRPLTRAEVLAAAQDLSATLPERAHVLNGCTSRYGFIVAFLAAILRGQITILPSDRTERVANKLAARYPGLYRLSDAREEGVLETVQVPDPEPGPVGTVGVSSLARQTVVATVYTSGSTGEPVAHDKTIGLLAATAEAISERFSLEGPQDTSLLATVPPQHMYGLEMTVCLPFWAGVSVHSGRPLFPADVASALRALPAPRILVTTPTHLKALLESAIELPPPAKIISATAPLSDAAAKAVEDRFDTEVCEIFGFSEAGTVATRRTVEGPRWRTCRGLTLGRRHDVCYVEGENFPAPVPMTDIVEVLTPDLFELRGRSSDTINIAGKRASLSGLNAILNELDGVRDGAFYLAEEAHNGGTARLVAFVVAPGRSLEQVRSDLRKAVDPAFLPRQIYFVADLPRSETGKLTQAALAGLLRRARRAGQ